MYNQYIMYIVYVVILAKPSQRALMTSAGHCFSASHDTLGLSDIHMHIYIYTFPLYPSLHYEMMMIYIKKCICISSNNICSTSYSCAMAHTVLCKSLRPPFNLLF